MKIVGYFNRLKLNIKFTIVTIFVTVIPIAILAGILFYYMEQSVIKEQLRQMEYKMEKAKSTTAFGIDSINMSTQFFLSDEDMTEVLKRAHNGDALTIQELLEFQERDVINLQRLVNNNPLLYSVRIFSTNDNVQELMPVLYSHSRMEKLSWAGEDPVQGWHFEYYDTAYSALTTNQSEKLIGLVTPIRDYRYGLIGYVEASMSLDTMFPLLYERKDGAGGCLIDADGNIYFGTEESEYGENEIQEIYGLVKAESDTETHYIRYNHQKLIVSTTQINEMNSTLLGIHDITREVQAVLDMRNVRLFLSAAEVDVANEIHDVGDIDAVTFHQFNAEVHIVQDRHGLTIVLSPCVEEKVFALVVLVFLLRHREHGLVERKVNERPCRLQVFRQFSEDHDECALVFLALHCIDAFGAQGHVSQFQRHFIEFLDIVLVARREAAAKSGGGTLRKQG